MKAGKIPNELLKHLLDGLSVIADGRLELGPSIGEDSAILNINEQIVLVGSDPITFPTESPGWHSVIINSNDIAASGGIPKWYTATILMPEGSSTQEFTDIFKDVANTCADMDIQLIGGHSEVTASVRHPIISGTMIGLANRTDLKPTNNAQIFDDILITKYCPIEGLNIILTQYPDIIDAAGLTPSEIASITTMSSKANMSIINEAKIVKTFEEVHSMHDPTEGGLATALREMLSASCVGAIIDESSLPIPTSAQKLCRLIDIDPLGLVASGSLLFTIASQVSDEIILALQSMSINCTKIGYTVPESEGVSIIQSDSGLKIPLPVFSTDEITKLI